MRDLLIQRILRQTTISKGHNGKPISELKQNETVYVFCQLWPNEMFVQDLLADSLVKSGVRLSGSRVKVGVILSVLCSVPSMPC